MSKGQTIIRKVHIPIMYQSQIHLQVERGCYVSAFLYLIKNSFIHNLLGVSMNPHVMTCTDRPRLSLTLSVHGQPTVKDTESILATAYYNMIRIIASLV